MSDTRFKNQIRPYLRDDFLESNDILWILDNWPGQPRKVVRIAIINRLQQKIRCRFKLGFDSISLQDESRNLCNKLQQVGALTLTQCPTLFDKLLFMQQADAVIWPVSLADIGLTLSLAAAAARPSFIFSDVFYDMPLFHKNSLVLAEVHEQALLSEEGRVVSPDFSSLSQCLQIVAQEPSSLYNMQQAATKFKTAYQLGFQKAVADLLKGDT
jgi:hypothetical protein